MQKKKQKMEEEEIVEVEQKEHTKPIEALEEMGIGMQDIQRLKKEGYVTTKSILMEVKKNLAKVKGITEVKLDKIIECAMKVEEFGFRSGL